MKYYSSVIILFYIYHGVNCNQESWYQSQIQSNILPPFQNAYKMLQERVLNELLNVNLESLVDNDDAVSQLASKLDCGAQNSFKQLEKAVIASNNLRQTIDGQLLTVINSIGSKESEITRTQSQIQTADKNVEGLVVLLKIAEEAVQQNLVAVQQAENEVRAAEDAVEEARKCFGKRSLRKKRGWFSSITKPIFKPIGSVLNVIAKPLCSVINSGGIDNAKDRRGRAHTNLNSAQQEAARYRNELAARQQEKSILEGQLNGLITTLGTSKQALTELQRERDITITLNEQLKRAVYQLQSSLTASSVLQDVMKNLIDFNWLIAPLNAIQETMMNNHVMASFGQITSQQMAKIKQTVEQVIAILPNMPWNTNWDASCIYDARRR